MKDMISSLDHKYGIALFGTVDREGAPLDIFYFKRFEDHDYQDQMKKVRLYLNYLSTKVLHRHGNVNLRMVCTNNGKHVTFTFKTK